MRKIDFDDSALLASAFKGVDRILLISTDAIEQPGRRLAQHKAAVAAAIKAGVKHVVYTSMPNPDDSVIPFAPDHLQTEQALAASSIGWSVLRNSWYMENLFRVLPSVLASGKWYTSAAEGRISYVSREDCARAAAAALADSGTANARYEITGPEKHTVAELASLVTGVTGKSIQVVQVSDEQLAQGLKEAGVPDLFVRLLVSFDANTREGKMDVLSDAVKTLTGKAPQKLRDFLAANQSQLAQP